MHPGNRSYSAIRRSAGRGPVRAIAAVALALAAVLLSTMACAIGQPAFTAAAAGDPTAGTVSSWSIVEITKPTPTVLPTPTALIVEPYPPETAPAAAQEGGPTAAQEDSPVITMVIVEDDSQSDAAPASPGQSDPNGKYVLVSIGEQHLYAYENGALIYSFVASTGMGNSTRVGSFRIQDKIPNAYGANWDIWMPNWMGIYWSGSLENGIHALPILPSGARLWSGYLGTPISYGCVVLGVDEALQLYEWADVGTPVEIRW